MAKTVNAIKKLIEREEKTLLNLKDTLSIMAHKESKALLKGLVAEKNAAIKSYKLVLAKAAKCPAIISKTAGKISANIAKKKSAVEKAVLGKK